MIQSVSRNVFSVSIADGCFIINARAQTDTTFRNGGGTIDYKPARKVHINLSSYFFTKQEYHHISAILLNSGAQGNDLLPGKFILNANVSYEPVKGFTVYCAGKNLLNSTAREFYYTDKVPL